MMEYWREWLYPLGFISSLAFGTRFLVQWITSEIRGESTVTRLFWKISLIGNLSLLVHSIIQMQYHVSFVQTCNAVISWRNLNLMGSPEKHASLKTTAAMMVIGLTLLTALFTLQESFAPASWFRIPIARWTSVEENPISSWWHAIGCCGLILFSSRFWVQWWCVEKYRKSCLGPAFWWLSLFGATLNLAYFIRIYDTVNLLGHAIALPPYLRNLMLMMKTKRTLQEGNT